MDTYQPHQRGKAARGHPLAKLAALTNTDEHQRMPLAHVVYQQTRLDVWPMFAIKYGRQEVTMAVQRAPLGRPLYDGMELARVTFKGPKIKVAIEGQTSIGIAFGQGRLRLEDVIEIASYVIEIIERLEAERA